MSSTDTLKDRLTLIRPARRQEARRIAEFYRLASDGVTDYVWSKLAEPGEDLLDVGARRYARENTPFSYQNCTVVEKQGRLIAMLVAFPMTVDRSARHEEDPVLAPYGRLEEDHSYYLCGLAVDPAHRRQGLATELMREAEVSALRHGLPRLSLIVLKENRVALDFYRKLGFREIKREALVPHPLIRYKRGHALLLVKDLPGIH